MKIMEFHNPIIWTFLPTGTALDIVNNIDRKLLVYYCIADFYALVDNPKKIKKTEDELLRKCDLIFVQGSILETKCKRLNNNVFVFPFGVKMEIFENMKSDSAETPPDMINIRKPIIGYIGGLHRHIDFALLRFIAESHPEWTIVLVGPIQTETAEVNKFSNVFFLGKKDFAELPKYINKFDICIIPYIRTEYTATVYPTKLNEYHALGKPVVSTDLPEVKSYNKENDNLVSIAKTYEEFTNHISRALGDSGAPLAQRRILAAKKNSWITRIDEMSGLIEESVERKTNSAINWEEKLYKLYRGIRIRILKTIIICLSLYFLIFYTPLMWIIAAPLNISQAPSAADCIVVFAGGVGESGHAGQGYEERVKYAFELYKKGFAKYLLFSSGYSYVYKEPFMMQVLAVSLGVPKEAIILEERATNTYENVKFSNQKATARGWDKVILVSSPYHMLRASLVFKKIAGNMKVIYSPVPNSLFYSHPDKYQFGKRTWRRIDIVQIRAILHEYMGIVYYWLKGWA